MKRHFLCYGLMAGWVTFASSWTALGDTIRVSGGITSFSGIVTPFNYYAVDPGSIACPPGVDCSSPTFGFTQLCPDAGCNTPIGMATNVPLGSPTSTVGTTVVFKVLDNPPGNELDFTPSGVLFNTNPEGEFKLGTITFTNGLWTGDADFGFSMDAFDSNTGIDYTFTGFLHMGATPNTGNPLSDADFISLTDASGNPLMDPRTLSPVGSLRVFELSNSPEGSSTASAVLLGTTGSLDPTRFVDVTGGGFLDPSTTDALSAPEPSMASLAGSALFGIWLVGRRRRRSS